MIKRLLSLIVLSTLLSVHISAQCDFDPRIEGDPLLCPAGSATLSTAEEYDNYQWFRRAYNSQTVDSIDGATERDLVVDGSDVLYYISVDTRRDGCTERSPEVLVDQLVFLPVVVATSGDFEVGSNGEAIICMEDTVYFTIQLPYDTLITWYRNGIALNEESTTLAVSEGGIYTVSGSPSVCPDYEQFLGVSLLVEEIDCTMGNGEIPVFTSVKLFPNPVRDRVRLLSEDSPITSFRLIGLNGQLLIDKSCRSNSVQFDVGHLQSGVYLVIVETTAGPEMGRLVVL